MTVGRSKGRPKKCITPPLAPPYRVSLKILHNSFIHRTKLHGIHELQATSLGNLVFSVVTLSQETQSGFELSKKRRDFSWLLAVSAAAWVQAGPSMPFQRIWSMPGDREGLRSLWPTDCKGIVPLMEEHEPEKGRSGH